MFDTILALTIIFVFSTMMLMIFDKIGQPAIPAYIIAGVIGGQFINETLLLDLVQFGILFLTFMLGIRNGSEEVLKNLHYGIKISFIQLLMIFAASFGIAYILGLNYLNASYFSIAAAFSSTLIAHENSIDWKEPNGVYRKISESMNIIEDFLAILIILFISIIPISLDSIGTSLLYGVLFICLGFSIREMVFPWLVSIVNGSSEFVMLIALSILSGFIWLSVLLEISIIVGAFVAGIALSKYPNKIKVLDTMGSLMDFFSVIFFVTLGALLILSDWGVIIYAFFIILFTMVIKPITNISLLMWQGYDKRTAINAALQLDHVSEFALMISIQAALLGLIETSLFNAVIIATVITIILSSYTSEYSDSIYHLLTQYVFSKRTKQNHAKTSTLVMDNHVVIIGYGLKGQKMVDLLKQERQKVLVIENDPLLITKLQSNGIEFLFADALDSITWSSASVGKARLVIVTAPKLSIAEVAVKQNTRADIIVTSNDIREAKVLLDHGASYVIIPLYFAREEIEKNIKSLIEGNPQEIRSTNLLHIKEQRM